MPTSNFQPIRLLDLDCCYLAYLIANSADPDQLASSDLHCLQRQGISGFSRTRVKKPAIRVVKAIQICCLSNSDLIL